jgi:lipopolysaccharide assembly protein A
MNTITNFLGSSLVAGWIITMAVFAIQNVKPVSLKFLQFESIKLPVGILLSGCLGLGFFIGSLLPVFLKKSKRPPRGRFSPQDTELEEFDF